MAWGIFADKIAQQFQGRVERLKNEKVKLEKELDQIQNRECTTDTAKRVSVILARLAEINNILANNAKD